MAPETGAIDPKYDRIGRDVSTRMAPETARLKASNPEAGEIAIAHCDTSRAHQQAVDRGHQAAEQGCGRREPDSSSLGHLSPLSWQTAGGRLLICYQSMYTRFHSNRFVCIAAFCILHRNKGGGGPFWPSPFYFAWGCFRDFRSPRSASGVGDTALHGTKIMFAS
jgi:hypothetical protein